jgi:LacI family transcriptional regulator
MIKQADEDGADSPSGKRATLRTIAELTGFSQSTVSLSLRGGTTLKEETRRRVAEAAAQVGYVPDRAGVRLRTGKTNVLALVLDRVDESIDFAKNLMQGIGQTIKGTRYHLNVTTEFDRSYSLESVRYILTSRAADGVILTHTSPQDPRVALLMEAGFPFITHGRTDFAAPHPYVDFHSEVFAELAVRRLAEKGCSNVLVVVGGDTTTNYQNILSGLERTAGPLGMTIEVVHHEYRAASAAMRQVGRDVARMKKRPDGIICDNELRSICIISGLIDEGVAIGPDIRFICKQTSDLLQTLYPAIDTIAENVLWEGSELARLLIRRITGEPAAALQTLSEPVPHWRD